MGSTIRLILICVVLVGIGGIAYTQVDWSKVGSASASTKPTNLIKSTSTSTRIGEKTITIEQKKPGLIMQIRMMFGYQPKNAHQADLNRLKQQRGYEAKRNEGMNSATGRQESTAKRSEKSSTRRETAPNRSLKSALGGG